MDWTVRTWDWLEGVKYIADEYRVYDGGFVDDNCTSVNRQQFSYNAAVLLQGAAFLYDYVSSYYLLRLVPTPSPSAFSSCFFVVLYRRLSFLMSR